MSNMMRALVKAKPEVGLWMENVPVPEVGPSDVLIRVKKSAICGTDVHIWNWDQWAQKTIPVPMVVGHEFVGVIAEIGSAVTKYHVGERVSGEGHPIIPVMLGDASLAQEMAARMLEKGVYVVGFSFPVVPKGQARIRTQMSAAHSEADVRRAIVVFEEVGRELGVI